MLKLLLGVCIMGFWLYFSDGDFLGNVPLKTWRLAYGVFFFFSAYSTFG